MADTKAIDVWTDGIPASTIDVGVETGGLPIWGDGVPLRDEITTSTTTTSSTTTTTTTTGTTTTSETTTSTTGETTTSTTTTTTTSTTVTTTSTTTTTVLPAEVDSMGAQVAYTPPNAEDVLAAGANVAWWPPGWFDVNAISIQIAYVICEVDVETAELGIVANDVRGLGIHRKFPVPPAAREKQSQAGKRKFPKVK